MNSKEKGLHIALHEAQFFLMFNMYEISRKLVKEDMERKGLLSSRAHHGGLIFFLHNYIMTFLTEIIVYVLPQVFKTNRCAA